MIELNPDQEWNSLEIRGSVRQVVEVDLPVELPLVVELNERNVATLMALPGMERELAVGFCLSEGLVVSFADILLVQYCRDEVAALPGRDGGVVVRVRARPEGTRQADRGERLVLSGCGSVSVSLEGLDLHSLPSDGGPVVPAARLLEMARLLRQSQGTYRRTGGVHAAGLFGLDGTLRVLAEDIGRHNAVDKALGWAAMRGVGLSAAVLLSTGRASHEIVTKALRLGVPIVGSLSVPTSLAVQLAEQGGCTLIGRLRRDGLIVYGHAERIA